MVTDRQARSHPVESDPRVRFVEFRELDRWDVAYYGSVAWRWPTDLLRPIGSFVSRSVVEVDASQRTGDMLLLEKITFGGRIQVRSEPALAGFKGRLFWAKPGQLIYSKIRIKQGSLAIVPPELEHMAVSAEYPVYDIDRTVVDPDYLSLVLRSKTFLDVFAGLAHGGSTKTRVSATLFEKQKIPVPSRRVQQQIVRTWRDAVDRRDATFALARNADLEADEAVLESLGLSTAYEIGRVSAEVLPKVLIRPWGQLSRWGVKSNQLGSIVLSLEDGPYPVTALRDLVIGARYGTNNKPNSAGSGTPLIRINNIKAGKLDLSDLKHVELSEVELLRYGLELGDLLVIRTSGSHDLVGTCAVFRETGRFVFASYLIRLRLDTARVIPEFVALFLNSGAGRTQIDATSRHIMQNNVNLEELRDLQIPLPPVAQQRALLEEFEAARQRTAERRASAEASVAASLTEVEQQIRGIASPSPA